MSVAESRTLIGDMVERVLAGSADEHSPPFPGKWQTVASLGWSVIGVPEEEGGAGGTLADLIVLAQAVGSSGASLPIAETALARWAARGAAATWRQNLVATVALAPDVSARSRGDKLLLRGELEKVAWASVAEQLIVAGPGWCALVPTGADGVAIDLSVNIAGEPRCRVLFDGAEALPLAGPSLHEMVRNRLSLLRVAWMLGAADQALNLTIQHALTREQFGRPIARFQLVAAAIAEMTSELELARGMLEVAVDQVERPESTLQTAAAMITAASCARRAARSSHQIHGAMGVTREYSLHRFTTRLWSWSDDCESERVWQERLGTLVAQSGPDAFWESCSATLVN